MFSGKFGSRDAFINHLKRKHNWKSNQTKNIPYNAVMKQNILNNRNKITLTDAKEKLELMIDSSEWQKYCYVDPSFIDIPDGSSFFRAVLHFLEKGYAKKYGHDVKLLLDMSSTERPDELRQTCRI